jgi:DNA-binding CsgD family transcriptional regulator
MDEVEQISHIIGDIYDASLDPALWPTVLESISGYLQTVAASIHSQDSVSKAANVHFTWGEAPDSSRYFKLYAETYGKLNPIFPGIIFFDVEQPLTVSEILPRDEFCRTRFAREWLGPQGYIDGFFSNLEKSPTSSALLTTMGRRFTDDEMRRRFEIIVPHVRRALLIGKVIDLHKVQAATLADSLDTLSSGMFIVDAAARIVQANASGHIMLAEGNVVRGPSGRLAACDLRANQTLLDAFTSAQAGDAALGRKAIAVPLTARDGESCVARVLPLTSGSRQKAGTSYSATAAVFVRKAKLDLPSIPEVVAKQFNLTPAEIRVLFAVVEIGGVPEIAPVLGIAEQTVKSHLHRIYEKTATKRQAELVKLVAGYSRGF